MRTRRQPLHAGAPGARILAAPARGLGRALRPTAQRALPSRRTRTRLRAHTRWRGAAVAAGERRERGHADRHRIFRWPRAGAGAGGIRRRDGETGICARDGEIGSRTKATRTPRQQRLEPGQPVRSVVAGGFAPCTIPVTGLHAGGRAIMLDPGAGEHGGGTRDKPRWRHQCSIDPIARHP